MPISYGGERDPESGDIRRGSRQIPSHLNAPKDQCLVKPAYQVVRCSLEGTEIIDVPGTVICSNPEHEHPELLPDPTEFWYSYPAWTPPQEVNRGDPYAG